jgi:hypothetical protein
MQHDAGCVFAILGKKTFQNNHDELHRSIVVVQQDDFIKLRLLKLGLYFLNDGTFKIMLGFIAHGSYSIDYTIIFSGHPQSNPEKQVHCATDNPKFNPCDCGMNFEANMPFFLFPALLPHHHDLA